MGVIRKIGSNCYTKMHRRSKSLSDANSRAVYTWLIINLNRCKRWDENLAPIHCSASLPFSILLLLVWYLQVYSERFPRKIFRRDFPVFTRVMQVQQDASENNLVEQWLYIISKHNLWQRCLHARISPESCRLLFLRRRFWSKINKNILWR